MPTSGLRRTPTLTVYAGATRTTTNLLRRPAVRLGRAAVGGGPTQAAPDAGVVGLRQRSRPTRRPRTGHTPDLRRRRGSAGPQPARVRAPRGAGGPGRRDPRVRLPTAG